MQQVLFMLSIAILTIDGTVIIFEKFEQTTGFDVYGGTLRVRKYNRTTSVLNGTFLIKVPVDNTFITDNQAYYSSLGNQQWTHYPIKLPRKGACDFLYSIYDDYYKYIEDIVNLPKKGECPITPREAYIINKIFPSSSLPPVLPKGLWKTTVTMSVNDVVRVGFEIILKAYADDYFGSSNVG
ncbi:AGAP008958-PA-like protein [Anopheles sinensis]|uniref:AGAP008958-PA-like protein n=1 Tax=Anopheles sinensis TaxID=74873 RepID=A0A084WQH2_ANOSI|nr:AGAP008958-PA-like protein [Anopheles sinensis]